MTLLVKDSILYFVKPENPDLLMSELCCDDEILEDSLRNADS